MQLGGAGFSVIQFLCLLLTAVTHPNRDQDNNSPQVMKSYQNNPSTQENGPSGCMQESKPRGKNMQQISYWNKPVLKADGFQAASPFWICHGKNLLQKPELQLWLPNMLQIPGQSMIISRVTSPLLSTGETPWSAVPSPGLPRTRDTWIYWKECSKGPQEQQRVWSTWAPGEPESWDCVQPGEGKDQEDLTNVYKKPDGGSKDNSQTLLKGAQRKDKRQWPQTKYRKFHSKT